MNDKKVQIIQAAIKLFGERDYHSASIQDIVSLAGVSKGAFYLHFHSKEELLVSIFRHYSNSFLEQMQQMMLDPELTIKQLLTRAISLQCKIVMSNKDFLSMQVKGIAFTQNEAIQDFYFKQNLASLTWFQERLVALYGEEIRQHSLDLASMLSGMLKEYFFYYIFYNHPIDSDQLSVYLMERLDDLAEGLLRNKKPPILTSEQIFQHSCQPIEEQLWESRVEHLKQAIADQVQDAASAKNMLLALHAVEAEFAKEDPNEIIIQGMYTYLQSLCQQYSQLIEAIDSLLTGKMCKG